MVWLQQTQLPSSTSVFNELYDIGSNYLKSKRNSINPIQIETQVPFWMVKNSDGYGNPSNMITFLQNYYEWLSNFYGYTGTNLFDVTELFDISDAPSFLLPSFVKYYAPDIYGIFGLTGDKKPSPDAIRNTIINIKKEIYEAKSTETTFKKLMGTLFEIDINSIFITYPKRKIMRLNGGMMEWMSNASNSQSTSYYGISGEYSSERYTLVGSYLNGGVLQDGNFWQEYSYVVNSSVNDSDPYYEEIVKETLHPAGMVGFYEQSEEFSEISEGDVEDFLDSEIPLIAHYYPYRLNSFETLFQCVGCTGPESRPGFAYPTFEYPSWDTTIANRIISGGITSFGSIKVIEEFTLLRSNYGMSSPNDIIGITCTAACENVGNAQFYGLCGGLQVNQPLSGITQAIIGSNIDFYNSSDFGFRSFRWQLGDGTEPINETNIDFRIPSVSHTYYNEGLYNVQILASKITGYTASYGVTFDIGIGPFQTLDCLNCYVYQNKLYAGITQTVEINRVIPFGGYAGTSPLTYTWSYGLGGTSISPSSSVIQGITYTDIGRKSIRVRIVNRFGESTPGINVNVIDKPVLGITYNNGILGQYVITGNILRFSINVQKLNNHTLADISYRWEVTSPGNFKLGFTSESFDYIFSQSGTYSVGLTYGSKIIQGYTGSEGITFYVGTVPTAAFFTRNPGTTAAINEGITFTSTEE